MIARRSDGLPCAHVCTATVQQRRQTQHSGNVLNCLANCYAERAAHSNIRGQNIERQMMKPTNGCVVCGDTASSVHLRGFTVVD